MLTLIRNAEVFAPGALGKVDVLVAGGRIAAVGERLHLAGDSVEEIDANGLWLLPGFVDLLTHPCGGGGEGGFANRTTELSAESLIRAGVTTAVGALGTDSLCRSSEVLYGAVMGLRARGLGAYMYSGSYRVPPVTLTGDLARDLVLVDPVIGVGEVAIADHRGSHPSAAELVRMAADVQLGAAIAGKRGTVLVHVGSGEQRLAVLREALASAELPADSFLPTHANRSRALLEEAMALARNGAWIDFTVSTTPEFITQGEVTALDALLEAVEAGVPVSRLTLSSDAGGSLPLYVDGELRGLQQAGPGVLLQLLREAITRNERFTDALAALTANPAAALGLTTKGTIAPGADADLLLYDPAAAELCAVSCSGHWLLRDGQCHCPEIPSQ